ncbi:binding-protein-dependent transport systems inner membrane component [Paenibacillus vortex V453]|jgi:putative aldouronate transport system permease protein|uniref:Sugar ABC transporter permease n=2 Tax=Paenibacillus TaxID=44249 RepID=A0A163IN04_9BACL|nr:MULTISPECIES: ABC transporter permease subunit [Paenibacillus]ANA80012.1 sugar ABC transporter permease [Paenibacillus glucanolyticus]AVV55962.1 sugar ABC transporter permease [Paenibacillus glucanolyticus]AWP30498.1 sugar ABC transporter permease [Paenibacillus sp. Cedars]EFU43725.1 binding-protein-dependent transport systems inner membrane component [Paenibacillus vortex V453]ETT38400.1 binding-protein-dependent transport systems inner membrane component [Paenibacillus sp. FSL R5-808]
MESSLHKKPFLKPKRKSILKQKWLYFMMLLPLTSLIIWNYIPMYGIIISFKDYSPAFGIMDSPWVGFAHFERFFNAFYFWDVIINTLRISLYSLLVGIPLPIILALMFNELRRKKYKSLAQTISYIPNFISIVIVVGMVTFFTSPVDGVINTVIQYFGGTPIDFVGSAKLFPHVFVWSGIWQTVGWGTLIYTAAMSGIPQDQYEAAYLEGATRLQCIRYITIPAIMPTIVICAILATGSVMSVGFEKVLLMQNDANLATSEVLSTYMYKSGILNAEYSFSAAVGLFNNLINFIVLYLVNKFAQKFSETSLW